MNHKLINNTAIMLADSLYDSTYEMGFVSRAIVKREFRENIQTLYKEKYPNVIEILFTSDIRVCFTNCRNQREHCHLDNFDIYFSAPEV